MARDPKSELIEMISKYARSSREVSPTSLQRDFKKVVKGVSVDALEWSLSRTIKSPETPSWQEILGQLYEHSSKQVRAKFLNALLEVAPEERGYLALPRNKAITPKDTERISVGKLTEFAMSIEPNTVIEVVSRFYAQHPPALGGLSTRVQGTILNGLARRGRVGLARRQPTTRPSMCAFEGPASAPEVATAFSAFTRLNAPDVVSAGEPFNFEVGFGSEPDTKADSRANSRIEVRAKPNEDMLVIVAVENGKILSQPNHARLPLKLDAEATFKALPAVDASYVRLSAEYLFRNEVVGTIVRTLAVAGRPAPKEEPEDKDLFWPSMQAISPQGVDLTLFVKLQEAGKITWQAVDRASGRESNMILVPIGDARSFAGELCGIQRKYGDNGFEAQQAIGVIGAKIADHIPQEIVSEFLTPLLKGATPPGVLILTNEPYVPWELAVLDPELTGKAFPQFLGAMARVGRWWVGRRIPIPPLGLKVEKISAIAADSYDLQANKKSLPEAKAEREWLSAEHHAMPVDGRHDPVVAWLRTLPIGPGHLAHFALHGYAVADTDERALILGDGTKIGPDVLAGLRLRNQDPRFGMVFLNACQVGTAGQSLGQIAGFPGELLRAGTGAVVGPLWEVNDVAAHKFAMSFYEKTYKDKDGVGVSEALRQLRENCDGNISLTPLAYIFYGHPGFTLSHVSAASPANPA